MRRVKESVDTAECRRRALYYLATLNEETLCMANCVGYEIWPDTKMTSQGMGGAASRILRGLCVDGLVEWTVTPNRENWGYRITPAGRLVVDGMRVETATKKTVAQ